MVVLKKIKSASLLEVLVSSVLVISAFVIASVILNNLFYTSVKNNTSSVEAFIGELNYMYQFDKLNIIENESFKNWNITSSTFEKDSVKYIEFIAKNSETKKEIKRQYIDYK